MSVHDKKVVFLAELTLLELIEIADGRSHVPAEIRSSAQRRNQLQLSTSPVPQLLRVNSVGLAI